MKRILIALILAASAAIAFGQQQGGGGVPGGNSGGGGTSATVARLPGTPNVVYSFIGTGDQNGTTVHDISGSSNNASLVAPNGVWTGTGLAFNASAGGATLPTGVISDLSYCAAIYASPINYTTSGAPPNALILQNGATSTLWSYTNFNPQGAYFYQQGAYSNFTSNSYILTTQATPAGYHVACWVLGNSGSDHIYLDGIESTPYSRNTGFSGGTPSGQWTMGPFSGLTFYYFAGWASQLTAAQVQQASLSITAAVNARGVPVAPATTPTAVVKLIADGDSITNGGGSSTTQWWPAYISGISSQYTVLNEGLSGTLALTMNENAPFTDTPQCYTGGQQSMAIIFGGTNDITVDSFSIAQTMGNIQGYVNYMTQAGCLVGVGTMISRAGEDSNKDLLNPVIRSSAAAGGYFVVDFASLPNLGADGAYSNTTYFNSDQVHPTNTGQAVLATAADNAINAYGIGSTTSANPTVYSSNTVTMVSADRFATIIPTAAATATLPDCLGVTGTVYQIFNASAGANTITFSGKASEAITGSATLAQNGTARFQATLISQAAAGCGWQRIQ